MKHTIHPFGTGTILETKEEMLALIVAAGEEIKAIDAFSAANPPEPMLTPPWFNKMMDKFRAEYALELALSEQSMWCAEP